jgi:dTDP-4-amino-4,6-dideoxygalactose transaminase
MGKKMKSYQVVKDFENRIAEFVGSPFAVAVDSCTNALFLCCKYLNVSNVTIPSKTYVSVPSAIIHAGGKVIFEDLDWSGSYQLKPYPIYDSACKIAKQVYECGTFLCLSFSYNKILNIGKGGMILTDNIDARNWFKLARYEGREEISLMSQEKFEFAGWNMYMTPEQAARGLILSDYLKDFAIISQNYPNLSQKYLAK